MKKKSESPKYYSLGRILAKNADYNIIFGERSNGKTYAALAHGLETFVKTGKQKVGNTLFVGNIRRKWYI